MKLKGHHGKVKFDRVNVGPYPQEEAEDGGVALVA